MKSTHLSGCISLVTAASLLTATAQVGVPTGTLSSNATVTNTSVMRVGAKPTITWTIQHPVVSVNDLVTVGPNGTVTAKVNEIVELRCLAAAVGPGSGQWYVVQGQLSMNGGSSWVEFFNNIDPNKTPAAIINPLPRDAVANSQIVIRSRCSKTGGVNLTSPTTWFPWYQSGTQGAAYTSNNVTNYQKNVQVYKNGDTVPPNSPAFNQVALNVTLASQIENGKFKIGDGDLIFLFELTETKDIGYDMNDLIVLATFKPSVQGTAQYVNYVLETDLKSGVVRRFDNLPASGSQQFTALGENGSKFELKTTQVVAPN
jgi:hypothetical protein